MIGYIVNHPPLSIAEVKQILFSSPLYRHGLFEGEPYLVIKIWRKMFTVEAGSLLTYLAIYSLHALPSQAGEIRCCWDESLTFYFCTVDRARVLFTAALCIWGGILTGKVF